MLGSNWKYTRPSQRYSTRYSWKCRAAREELHKEVLDQENSQYQAAASIEHADQYCYGILLEDLENYFLGGNEKYSKNIQEVYDLLLS